MFHHVKSLAYTVRVDSPNPVFARMLQQAIGGVEGEMRVMLQYLFQGTGSRAPGKYRDMLLNTATEEIGHIEMLATAVAMNLEGAETELTSNEALHPVAMMKMAGQDPRHYLSAGLAATPTDANGVPFDASHVYASGNLVADMHANVAAEATGRVLATRLWHMTDDAGMKDMLSFLIARDTMHQNQWLAAIEEIDDPYPAPSDFPQEQEHQQFSYSFFEQSDATVPRDARWTSGRSIDGKGEFQVVAPEPYGQVPELGEPRPETFTRVKQHAGASGDGGGRFSR
jgi:Mn-containing catalase